ncbi:MAG: phosphotransferase [Alphaproteobacteria bacterium]|nr:phosphotransferase [Alphaproteobacteria bacterium]
MNVSSALEVGRTDSLESERKALRTAFLKREGLEKEALLLLPADASKRRYFRLPHALLMDAPPPAEKTAAFQFIADLLYEIGLSVPLVYAADHIHGFLLIEDLGDLTYRRAMEEGVAEDILYGDTVRGLAHLHQKMTENTANFSPYDLEAFLKEAEVFLDWSSLFFSEKAKDEFRQVWTEAYENQPSLPQRFVMRDVLIDNLMWLPSREGFNRSGFIDFQDGVHEGIWGPITYDLVSLLEDARRDIDPTFAEKMLEIYFGMFPELNRGDFFASYCLWGAQRSTKILGVFSRLAKRDGKAKYLVHLPRVWKILERDLQHPHLKAVRQWFDAYVGKR